MLREFDRINRIKQDWLEKVKKSLHHENLYSIMSIMKTMTYTAARENLAKTMQHVCEDHDPVVVTRRRDQAVVMMSMEDYSSLEETSYLLRSPKNAKRLRDAVDQLLSGGGHEYLLSEL